MAWVGRGTCGHPFYVMVCLGQFSYTSAPITGVTFRVWQVLQFRGRYPRPLNRV